jgi:hypothetical protein
MVDVKLSATGTPPLHTNFPERSTDKQLDRP